VLELWRDGEKIRTFDGFKDIAVKREGDVITLQFGSDYIEIVTGDELRIDCVKLVEAFETVKSE
jgi:hypothetical protein